MHDLISVAVECITNVDRVVSAWPVKRHFLAWGLLIDTRGDHDDSDSMALFNWEFHSHDHTFQALRIKKVVDRSNLGPAVYM